MADDPDKTNPGLTQAEDGTISIGPAASQASLDRALADQKAAMQAEQDALNEALASGRAPGAPVGSDQPDTKKGSGS